MEWCERFASDRRGCGLDLGGRYVNGTARGLWPNLTWTVLDLIGDPSNHLDRVITADAQWWKPDQTYDVVLSTELLEHVSEWWRVIGTMARALKSDGVLIITCAGPGRAPHSMHGEADPLPGEPYANVDPDRLERALRVWNLNVEVDVTGDDVRAVARWDPRLMELVGR